MRCSSANAASHRSSGEFVFSEDRIRKAIRDIPDYPKPGILFKDITPLLKEPALFAQCIDELAVRLKGAKIDYVVGIESRGFIVGAALAMAMGKGFIPIRKKGKLPHDKVEESYDLEYGSATIEMHRDAIKKGQSVVIVDDVLATGGTAKAAIRLVEGVGGKVSALAFVIELRKLNGRKSLKGESISLIEY
jgi:adenine phosphoribosyltransferase